MQISLFKNGSIFWGHSLLNVFPSFLLSWNLVYPVLEGSFAKVGQVITA